MNAGTYFENENTLEYQMLRISIRLHDLTCSSDKVSLYLFVNNPLEALGAPALI